MAKIGTSEYSSINSLKEKHGIILPRPYDWRLCFPVFIGGILGIPKHRGKAVATNGILLAIETEDEQILYGHVDSFVADDDEGVEVTRKPIRGVKSKRDKTVAGILSDILEFV